MKGGQLLINLNVHSGKAGFEDVFQLGRGFVEFAVCAGVVIREALLDRGDESINLL